MIKNCAEARAIAHNVMNRPILEDVLAKITALAEKGEFTMSYIIQTENSSPLKLDLRNLGFHVTTSREYINHYPYVTYRISWG